MLSQRIRRAFLDYFMEKGHTSLPSSPVIPKDDPTLLFTNAGMNQFKDVFLGKDKRSFTRATTSQKCIRAGGKHNDLDNVGHTKRHLTFFEMLGNFSFADYFKKEAIAMAFEVSTTIFKFDKERIFVSVFETDDEAHELWKAHLPKERIVRMGVEDNYWSMGDTGPCGPCTELYYDLDPTSTKYKTPADDPHGERFLEFWNLVFMQYNQDSNGHKTPLPKPCVDTGAGLERVLSIMEGVDSVFQTDVFKALINEIEMLSGVKYDRANADLSSAFHVIADHIRCLAFAMADGAVPSNIGRGYVLRRILRRAVRYAKQHLNIEEPFLGKLVPKLIEVMGADYPELAQTQEQTRSHLEQEEQNFHQTLRRGGNILSSIIEKAKKDQRKTISGEDAFKLKDTYGFPLEEIMLMAKDAHLEVALDEFNLIEEQAKELSRKARTAHSQEVEESVYTTLSKRIGSTAFIGYAEYEDQCTVKAIISNGQEVCCVEEGQEAQIFIDRTPFYAEGGGQVGDIGVIRSSKGQFEVSDTQLPFKGLTAHIGKVKQGRISVDEPVMAVIDLIRRQRTAKNHTATHLLHWALCEVLGPHVMQAGSIVRPDLLRFDFNHHKAMSREEIREVERCVNEKIRSNSPVNYFNLSRDEVKNLPDVKQIFDDKYDTTVRLVDIGFSKELCGGTHTNYLGSIGLFRILHESSISAGVRRIEAVTGDLAEELMMKHEEILEKAEKLVKAKSPDQLLEKIENTINTYRELQMELKTYRKHELKELAVKLINDKKEIGGIPTLIAHVQVEPAVMQDLAGDIASRAPSLALFLASAFEGRCQLLARVSKDLQSKIKAGDLIAEAAPYVDGRGGGGADSAQGGGQKPAGIAKALEAVAKKIEAS